MIFGVYLQASLVVIMFKREKSSFVSHESSFPIPLKYIDVVRRTNTTVDVLQESQIYGYWKVDGDRQLCPVVK